jgi:hypothetical protein
MNAAPGAPRRIAELCDEAVGELKVAQRLLAELQRPYAPATWGAGTLTTVDVEQLWHRLESIDDRIHNALGKLGD